MLVVSDANWAMAMQALSRGKPGLGILFGGGIALWVTWILGSWLGLHFGSAIENPVSFGLDMVMGCFLLAMVVGGKKNLRMFIIWTVAARSEEHTSELQSLMRISYAVFCLKKKK